MAIVKLKHVNTFPDRHGKLRSYFRYPGQKAVALPGLPGSVEFMVAYNMALGFAPQIEVPADKKRYLDSDRTIAALVAKWKKAHLGKINAEKSRKDVAGILDRFAAKHGKKSAVRMSVDDCMELFGEMSETPGAHNNLLRRFRILMGYAVDIGWRQTDPSRKIKPMKLGTHHTWNEEEIELFEKAYPLGTRERTAFELALHTGQRVSDLCKMSWRDYDEESGKIVVVQTKGQDEQNDSRTTIFATPDLKAALAAWKETCRREKRPASLNQTIITTERGTEYNAKTLGEWLTNKFGETKLPKRCVPHGLRKAACRRLAEAGCSALEIMAITGHKSIKEVQRYCAMAEKLKLAGSAEAKMREHFRKDVAEAA